VKAVIHDLEKIVELSQKFFRQVPLQQPFALALQFLLARQQIYRENDAKEERQHAGGRGADCADNAVEVILEEVGHLHGNVLPVEPLHPGIDLGQIPLHHLAAHKSLQRRRCVVDNDGHAFGHSGHHHRDDERDNDDDGQKGQQQTHRPAALLRQRRPAFLKIVPLVKTHEDVHHIGDHQSKGKSAQRGKHI